MKLYTGESAILSRSLPTDRSTGGTGHHHYQNSYHQSDKTAGFRHWSRYFGICDTFFIWLNEIVKCWGVLFTQPEGATVTRYTSLLLDLKNRAHVLRYLDIPVEESPIIPYSKFRRYVFGSPRASVTLCGIRISTFSIEFCVIKALAI